MKVAYLSITGNVQKLVEQQLSPNFQPVQLNIDNPFVEMNEKFIVITPTYNSSITDLFTDFINYKNNKELCIGIVGSGNKNFGQDYCLNAYEIANEVNKPLLMTMEFNGTNEDIEQLEKEVSKYWNHQN